VLDRKKEMIVPTSGHNVSPIQLESRLKSIPLIGQACAIGTGRPHVVALLVLDPEALAGWASRAGIEGGVEQLHRHPDLLAMISQGVDQVNDGLSPAERIRGHAVLADVWVPDSDV